MLRPGEGNEHQPPSDLQDVDRLLRKVRFQPRSSLEPEVLARVARGEPPQLRPETSVVHRFALAALAIVIVAVGFGILAPEREVVIDRCCYDLDGGGPADDGALIIAEPDGRVHRLTVYEDRDESGTLTAADIIRLERTGAPRLEGVLPPGLTIRYCCQDFDGGGPPDDELLIIASPPDRVHTAAIYELR